MALSRNKMDFPDYVNVDTIAELLKKLARKYAGLPAFTPSFSFTFDALPEIKRSSLQVDYRLIFYRLYI